MTFEVRQLVKKAFGKEESSYMSLSISGRPTALCHERAYGQF